MKEITNLAFGASRVMLLRFRPFGTVKRLMGHKIVHGGELDAARGADQLDQRRRGRAWWRWTVTHRGFPRLAIVFLVRDKVLVAAEYDVAFFASGGTAIPNNFHMQSCISLSVAPSAIATSLYPPLNAVSVR